MANSQGQIEREYAVGSGRMDLHIRFAGEQFAIELKLKRKGALAKGKEQLAGYLEKLNLEHGYLVLFQRGAPDPTEIGTREEVTYQGKRITVLWF